MASHEDRGERETGMRTEKAKLWGQLEPEHRRGRGGGQGESQGAGVWNRTCSRDPGGRGGALAQDDILKSNCSFWTQPPTAPLFPSVPLLLPPPHLQDALQPSRSGVLNKEGVEQGLQGIQGLLVKLLWAGGGPAARGLLERTWPQQPRTRTLLWVRGGGTLRLLSGPT